MPPSGPKASSETREGRLLYCYVDESGQDPRSAFFIVVAVTTLEPPESLRSKLIHCEDRWQIARRKWHKSRAERRMGYLRSALAAQSSGVEVCYGSYRKPSRYFAAMVDLLGGALNRRLTGRSRARIYVDGIDRKNTVALTGALRKKGLAVDLVRSRRDQSEPLIRLADMWAGCIRGGLLGGTSENELVRRAVRSRYLIPIADQTK